ncbi:MAG: hypothetical protein KHW62_05570 [Clostridiales bacterium]|nr:hypothetical protein [Clostridiales bacterium]
MAQKTRATDEKNTPRLAESFFYSRHFNIVYQIFIAKADYLGFYKGVTNTEVFPFIVF